ncbi:MBL fold metallo-hydrolase [Virgisporangium aurantiacum]|uniref:MBL fold metallo-hydrolase n=1 Tax=Virgisporangium aurantiacum TaxID=175570 RepID=A0A8J3YZ94_9ACTN|nr:MBL fold metallo-hydrolase [Virgisporangium aurantiacum]GIJ54404.1 MBL fold metallo-hydrolase [Virgisporangium aurantiacum]
MSSLSIDVFTSGYKPISGGPGWDDSSPATWPASTSTLIAGHGDAVLVDALLTVSEGQRLAAWVRNSGKRLRAIVVTHAHADHFFGAGPVLDAFPDARLLASDQQVVDEARAQTTPGALARWNAWFPGRQVTDAPATPVLAGSSEFHLDGRPLVFRTIGGADGVLATIVHVPDLRAVCAGDIVYNNVHMWLRGSTPDSRRAWLASLDAVAALTPSTIITGHRDPAAPDDDAGRVLDQSRRYIEDFDRTVAVSGTPQEVIDTMVERYPAHGNRYTLFVAAVSQFPPHRST